MATPAYYKYLSEDEIALEEGGKKSPSAPSSASPAPASTGGMGGDKVSSKSLSDLVTGDEPRVGITATISGDKPLLSGVSDILTGIAGGAVDAVKGTLNAPADIAETVGAISPETAKTARVGRFIPEIAQQDSVAGDITRAVTKYGLGFLGAGKVTGGLKAVQALRATGFAGKAAVGAAQGALGDALVSDPEDGRLADLIEKVPVIGQNAIVEYLATDESDSRGEARFKAALDGIVPGVLIEGVMHVGVKAFKQAKALRAAGKHEAADAVIEKAGVEIDQNLAKAATTELPEEIPSRMVQETAEGIPVFHGTGESFSKVEMEKIPGGFWVAEQADTAGKFAEKRAASSTKQPSLFDFISEAKRAGNAEAKAAADVVGHIEEIKIAEAEAAKLFAKYPEITSAIQPGAAQVRPYFLDKDAKLASKEAFSKLINEGVPTEDIAKRLRDHGFDGAITEGTGGKGVNYLIVNPAKLTEKFTGEPADAVARAAAAPADVKSFFTKPPAQPKLRPAFHMDDEARALFRENIREHVLRGSELDLPLEGTVFNYSTMKSSADVKRVIDDLAQTAGEGLKDARGMQLGSHRSHQMTSDVADMLGLRPEVFRANLARRATDAKNMDSYLVAAKTFVQSQARDIADLAKRLEFGTAGPQAEVELARRIDILADTMNDLGAIQTGAARTTSAGRIRTADSVSPDQVAKLLDQSTSEEVRKLAAKINMANGNAKGVIAAVKPMTTAGKALAVHNFIWINSILSGIKTTGVNLVSTAVNTLIRPGQRLVGGVMTGNTQQMREALYQYAALHHNVFDSLKWAADAWNLDRGILDISNSSSELMGRPLSSKALGIENSPIAHGVDFIGKVVGIPGRFLNSQDEFFKQINYRSNIMARAWVDAEDMIQKGALRPEQQAEFVQQRMSEAIGHMGQALDKPALLAAQEATFTQSLKSETWLGNRSLSEVIAQGPGAHPLLKGTILPFIKVPTNLMRTFIDTGPLAPLRKQFWSDINQGGERQAMALGKLGTGVMLWTGATMLALSGRVTGAGPRDPDLQRQRRQNGWQPYSFVFNNDDGTKSYVSFGKLDPLAYIFGIAGDWAEMSGKLDDVGAESMATDMVVALAQSISSKTYLRGIIDVMGALGGGYDNEERVQRLIRYRLGSYVPSILGLANPDDSLKQVRSIADSFMARIPGLSDSVEAKRDNFGQKMEAPMGYPWNAINPFSFTTTEGDRVREELSALARSRSEAKFPIPAEKVADGNIDLTEFRSSKGQTAHDRWLEMLGEHKVGGRTLYDSLHDLIGSDSYKSARTKMGEGDPTYKQSLAVDLIKGRFKMYHDTTFLKLRKEFPELDQTMREYAGNSVRSRVGGPSQIIPNELIGR